MIDILKRFQSWTLFSETQEILGKRQVSRLGLANIRTKYVLNSKWPSIVPLCFCGANSCSK